MTVPISNWHETRQNYQTGDTKGIEWKRVIHAILKSIVRDHKSGHCDIRYYKAATLNVWKENQKNTKYRLL